MKASSVFLLSIFMGLTPSLALSICPSTQKKCLGKGGFWAETFDGLHYCEASISDGKRCTGSNDCDNAPCIYYGPYPKNIGQPLLGFCLGTEKPGDGLMGCEVHPGCSGRIENAHLLHPDGMRCMVLD